MPTTNRESRRKSERKYRETHRKELNERRKLAMRKMWKEQPEKIRALQNRYRFNTRKRLLEAYGGKCACCGETEIKFLTFDHKNNDGAAQRRALRGGNGKGAPSVGMFYAHIRKNKPTDIQVLCFNCNCAKGCYGKCPHQL
jgi:hypothetical protein